MAVKSYAQQLEEVQDAIATIESGAQQYAINGRTITRADLAVLYKREQWLRNMADREARGGINVKYVVPEV